MAEVYEKVGQAAEGMRILTEAFTLVTKIGRHCYESEVSRLKGELLAQQAENNQQRAKMEGEAEPYLHQALTIARRQQAKSLELRAAISLARLWQSQGKRQDAYDLLAPVYNWFTEGFDTVDLQEAKALLAALA
jgi:predicted ATPase